MSFVTRGDSALNYHQCRYGGSKLLFRGPRRRAERTTVAMLGGAETYGRFIETPYPALIEERLGTTVLNLGYPNAGVDVFLNERAVIDMCRKAKVTVIQVLGAQNLTNRFYSVHPRRNDRFVRASQLLQTIYRDMDFTEFNFTRHLLAALEEGSSERFAQVADEVRGAWVARMKTLLAAVGARRVLLWVADHAPGGPDDFDPRASDPLFVTRAMLDEVHPMVDALVEVVPTAAARAAGTEGMIFRPEEECAAATLPGIAVHREVADALETVLAPLLQ
jgi:hypothetical protein